MENPQDAAIGEKRDDLDVLKARVARLEAIIEAEFGARPVGPTLKAILEATERASGFSHAQLIARARRDQPLLTKWRSIAMLVCRQKTDASFREIGRKFGGRELSTIRNLVGNADKYPDLRSIALMIEKAL